jgi:hypothetical protein
MRRGRGRWCYLSIVTLDKSGEGMLEEKIEGRTGLHGHET